MSQALWLGLINNASMLLALSVVYEVSYIIAKDDKRAQKVISGILIAGVCLVIMSLPYHLYEGIVFDTRTILISVTAFSFGPIPASITALVATVFRLQAGGSGALMGIATIISSCSIGLIWRYFFYDVRKSFRFFNIYAMSLVVHVVLLLCAFLLPPDSVYSVIRAISLPVMLIYPVVSVLLSMLLMHQQERRQYDEQLKESEERYRRVTENMSDILWTTDLDLNLTFLSGSVEKLFGETPAERALLSVSQRLPAEHVEKMRNFLEEEIQRDNEAAVPKDRILNIELQHYKKDRTTIWLAQKISLLRDASGLIIGLQGTSYDISEKKKIETALAESERSKAVLISQIPGVAYRCSYDKDWTMLFISEGCYELTGYIPEDFIGNKRIAFNDIICEEYRQKGWRKRRDDVASKLNFKVQYEIETADGKRKWIEDIGHPILDSNGNIEVLEGLVFDITESKKTGEYIQYMVEHDFMTGVYNRNHFESMKETLIKESKLPISIIMADINGVRLINDAFGHSEGDQLIVETAKIFKSCSRKQDIVARTGGDEFEILLPCTSRDQAYEVLNSIKEACECYNANVKQKEMQISLALGFGTKENVETSIDDAEKEAEEMVNKSKRFEAKSYHSAVLSSIRSTLYVRSHETEAHALRIAEVSIKIGQELKLAPKDLEELQLFSMLHDIGKIGIEDSILNKPEKLTEEEWKIIKKHSEIGYRIAKSVPEIESVAEYILTHHERWDGNGYPEGRKGTEIPLASRIVAVADSYDAMTEDRVYQKSISKEEALEEIQRNAGTQFDPEIVQIFNLIIKMI
ncbi:MAG: diguanylate cyclase [Clostridia bacterium]|nr:diguanylate cyclase [Clostridia bacterium]